MTVRVQETQMGGAMVDDSGNWKYDFTCVAVGPEITDSQWHGISAEVWTDLLAGDTMASFEARRAANMRAWVLAQYPNANIPTNGVALIAYKLY
jgi:hypothetical protein